MSEASPTEQQLGDKEFNKSEPLLIAFDAARMITPSFHGLRVRVQGQILFIGDYWLTVAESRALRDWLTEVLP